MRDPAELLADAAHGVALYLIGHGDALAPDAAAWSARYRTAAALVPDGPLAAELRTAADRLTSTAALPALIDHDALIARGSDLICGVLPLIDRCPGIAARQVRFWLLRIALAVVDGDPSLYEQRALDEIDRLLTPGRAR